MFLGFFMSIDAASVEALNIFLDHVRLALVTSILQSLTHIKIDLLKVACKLTVFNIKFLALELNVSAGKIF